MFSMTPGMQCQPNIAKKNHQGVTQKRIWSNTHTTASQPTHSLAVSLCDEGQRKDMPYQAEKLSDGVTFVAKVQLPRVTSTAAPARDVPRG